MPERTTYRLDSRPPGGTWVDGPTYPSERRATFALTRLAKRRLPGCSLRVVRVHEATIATLTVALPAEATTTGDAP